MRTLDVAPLDDAELERSVEELRGDIRDPKAARDLVEGADVLVHAAAALPIRASREALGLSTGGSSTPSSLSRKPGVPSACSAYIGWKQPAVNAAMAATAKSRAAMRILANDIHDPLGNYDHLAGGLVAQD